MLAILYRITGSLWLIADIHWIVEVFWLYGLGGRDRFPQGKANQQTPQPPSLALASTSPSPESTNGHARTIRVSSQAKQDY
jgi:hypothetical protein